MPRMRNAWLPLLYALLLASAGCSKAISVQGGAQIRLGTQLLDDSLQVDGLTVRDVIRLPRVKYDDLTIAELSGLAWSNRSRILYAISDRGYLVHFHPVFIDNRLRGVDLLGVYPLRDQEGRRLSWPWQDSEGLQLRQGTRDDDELIVSYELRPRVWVHDAKGNWLTEIALPGHLRDKASYRRWNLALESVVMHPQYGAIVTPEASLRNVPDETIVLYSGAGKRWQLPRGGENLAVVAMEMMPDGDILMLQRRHQLLGEHWDIRLRKVRLGPGDVISDRWLARLGESPPFLPLDNLEGLAHHQGNRYFMISDDNEHLLQDTLLYYVEVLP